MPDPFVMPGVGIGRRAVFGPVARMSPPTPDPPDAARLDPVEQALAQATAALAAVAGDLRGRADAASGVDTNFGTDAAAARVNAARPDVRGAPATGSAPAEVVDVLLAQAAMAEDPVLADEIAVLVSGGKTPARAAFEAFGRYREALAAAGPYLAARVADLDDVRRRVVAACLVVAVPGMPEPGHPYVLVATDLAPADTAVLDLTKILGVITEAGGSTSHTAVLARARDIPAVVGCADAGALRDGDDVLVDPVRSTVIRDPAEHQIVSALATEAPAERHPAGPGRTADGYPVALLANIGSPADIAAAHDAGAEGVGLYRTELLFLDAETPPSHETQLCAYRQVFDGFAVGCRIVIRVLDAGADKPLAFLGLAAEPNPALGVRGLRALRVRPAVLDAQLAAIAEAARGVAADIWVMAPMVADAEDAAWFAGRVVAHGLPVTGVMIEIPSAALLADEILAEVDFVSVGTNDLAQYALAVDRQAGGLAALQDPWHPGVLRLVAMVGEAGTRRDRPVGVCGEAAADPGLARVLVGLGVTSLSMAPGAIGAVRASLREVTIAECRMLAARVLAAGTAAQARLASSPAD